MPAPPTLTGLLLGPDGMGAGVQLPSHTFTPLGLALLLVPPPPQTLGELSLEPHPPPCGIGFPRTRLLSCWHNGPLPSSQTPLSRLLGPPLTLILCSAPLPILPLYPSKSLGMLANTASCPTLATDHHQHSGPECYLSTNKIIPKIQ